MSQLILKKKSYETPQLHMLSFEHEQNSEDLKLITNAYFDDLTRLARLDQVSLIIACYP